MPIRYYCLLLFSCFPLPSLSAQSLAALADSLRIASHIPALSYAVLSSDSILEMQALGVRKNGTPLPATPDDLYRIGSNTKTVTGYLAMQLVQAGVIRWDTKFFDLYPALKRRSHPAYHEMTLLDLLSFRIPLISWTYTDQKPRPRQIRGNAQQQRKQFVAWILQQQPQAGDKPFYWSNPAYVAAGMMLEQASGLPYETLVTQLGAELGTHFGFGQPNLVATNQIWGHYEDLSPEMPTINHKLNWLSAAGNLHVSLPDYARFIQLHLRGLAGRSRQFSSADFHFLHYGRPEFSIGWNWFQDQTTGLTYSWHKGNPGAFLSLVYLCKERDRAFIIFANVQSKAAETGLRALLERLRARYGA